MMNLTAHLIRTLLIALATLAASGPATARFLSVDPAPVSTADGSNFNRYWYANNNPYRYVDPDGRHPAAIVACTSSPACVGAVISAAGAIVTGAKAAYDSLTGNHSAYNEIVEDSASPEAGDASGDGVVVTDKIRGQMGERGWTEEGIRDAAQGEATGTSTDNTGGRNDPATVYGAKDSGHVVVNDKTGEVVQVSDKTDPSWKPDPRIKWNEGTK